MLKTAAHLVTLSCVLDLVLSASHSPYVFSVMITTPEVKVKVLVSWWHWTLCDPMDYSLPSSSANGILQAGVLEWVAISFSRKSS